MFIVNPEQPHSGSISDPFVCSSGSEGLPEGATLHQLPEVPAVLEGARVLQVPEVRRRFFLLHSELWTVCGSFGLQVSDRVFGAPCRYPHCLHMLELLQYEHFRKEQVNAQCAKFIDEQQLLHWQHYSRKRTRLQQALAEQQQAQQPPQPHGNAAAK